MFLRLITSLLTRLPLFAGLTLLLAVQPGLLYGQTGATLEKVTIQLKWLHQFQFAGYYAAIEQGFYAQQGLEVELLEYDGKEDMVDTVLSGKADYGITDSALLLARGQGRPVKLVSQIFQHSPIVFLSLADSGIISPYELKGKRVMYGGPNQDSALHAMLLDTLGTQLPFTFVQHSMDYHDLIDGKVDAIAAYLTDEPFWFAEQQVKINIINPANYGIDFYGDNLFTSEQELANHPGRAQRLRQATLQGWQYALDHPEQIITLLKEKYNCRMSLAALRFEASKTGEMVLADLIPLGETNLSRYQRIAQVYARLGLIDSPVIPDGFLVDYPGSAQMELSDDDVALLSKHPVLRLGCEANWPPINFVDGAGYCQGITMEYLQLVSQRLGIQFKPSLHGDWQTIFSAVHDGDIDLVGQTVSTPERQATLALTDPYFNSPYAIVINRHSPLAIRALDDLRGQRVAMVEGYYLQEYLTAKLPSIQPLKVRHTLEALKAVAEERADAFVGNRTVISYLMAQEQLSNLKIAMLDPVAAKEHCFALGKELTPLIPLFNKAIATISQAEHRQILSNWLGHQKDEKKPSQLNLDAEEKRWLAEHHKIRLGIDIAWPPVELIGPDGSYQGMASDFIAHIEQSLGVETLVDKELSWSEVMAKTRQGEIDLLPAVARTPERESYLLFTEPYITFPFVIFTRKELLFIDGLADLEGKKVAVEKSYMTQDYLERQWPQLSLTLVESSEEALRQLAAGKVDAWVGNLAVGSFLIEQIGLTNVEVAALTPLKFALCMAVRKEWAPLLPLLQRTLDQIAPDQKLAIRKKWLGIDYDFGVDYGLVRQVLAGTLLIIIIAMLWIGQVQRRNRALAAAMAEAEQANEFKSKFLANMSHEIRTPMNAIMGMTHLAMQTELSAKQLDYLSKIHNSSQSLLSIINDILDFSKIEAGKLSMEKIPFQLSEVLERLSGLATLKAEKKGLEILFKVEADVPQAMVGDPLRLGQVLINLTDNAIKFTEQGEVLLTVALEKQTQQESCIVFSVRDTGIGLSDEQQQCLFHAFTQADGSTTRRYGGTGLGLTICKQLVELMNGTIEVKSELGKGSTFRFTACFERLEGSEQQTREVAALHGLPVLVVDDSEMAREVIGSVLSSFNFEVTAVASGQEALELLEAGKQGDKPGFKLVLMDWQMPHMDGIEATRRIKAMNFDCPPTIIMVTAYGREEIRQQAEEVGMDGFLIKPVNPSLLLDSIMSALGLAHESLPQSSTFQAGGMKKFPGAHVLLVEDNELNRQVGRELLQNRDVQVSEAIDGVIAVDMASNHTYDAILMDIQMPRMDGLTATAEIRKFDSHTPIIATTAHAMVEQRQQCLDCGMNDHLAKPLDPAQLELALEKWLPASIRVEEDQPEPVSPQNEMNFPVLPGLDTAKALHMLDNNPQLLDRLLRKFPENHGQTDQEITALLAAGDVETAHRAAHTTAGVAGTIGAYPLEAKARQLMAVIKDGQDATVALAQFSTQLQQTLDVLQGYASQPVQAEKSLAPTNKPDQGQLAKLLLALHDPISLREPSKCRTLLAQIDELVWPPELADDLRELIDLTGRYKFKEAQDVLALLLEKL